MTWAYFSVSAMRSWVLPVASRHSPNVRVQVLGREGRSGGHVVGVAGEGHVGGEFRAATAFEAVEFVCREGLGQLAGSVRPEVHEYDRIAVRDRREGATRLDCRRLNELVALAPGVGGLEGRLGGGEVECRVAVPE